MSDLLYCYWGNIGDHNLNIPGHPLYQVYFLESLKETFQTNKIYFYSFLKNYDEQLKFFILSKEREEIFNSLNIEVVDLKKAIELAKSVDVVCLKARFRNKSRLEEKSYDALKFEKILESASKNKNTKPYVIDSDGELNSKFFNDYDCRILTYFNNHEFYTQYDKSLEIQTVIPILSKNFKLSSKDRKIESDLVFIGNEGLKSSKLSGWLQRLSEENFNVVVNGKWKSNAYTFKIYDRLHREQAYQELMKTLSVLQVSKEKYATYDFLSPRVYESLICGVVPFIDIGYTYSTKFTCVESYVDLREKLKCLREGYERDYDSILSQQIDRMKEIENFVIRGERIQNHQQKRISL